MWPGRTLRSYRAGRADKTLQTCRPDGALQTLWTSGPGRSHWPLWPCRPGRAVRPGGPSWSGRARRTVRPVRASRTDRSSWTCLTDVTLWADWSAISHQNIHRVCRCPQVQHAVVRPPQSYDSKLRLRIRNNVDERISSVNPNLRVWAQSPAHGNKRAS